MDKNYDFKFKILLLGGCSGKTCLLKRYIDNIFPKQLLSTIGIDFKTKLVEFDKYQIKLVIWDSAGKESYRNISKQFYKGVDGFIFNFNITDKYTLKRVDDFINDVKIERNNDYDSIICANCWDLEEEREITKELIKFYELKYNIKIFETSAKSGLNVNRAFNYLVYQILKRKANKQVLSSFEKWSNILNLKFEEWSNILIDKFEILLFIEPNCKNIFKKQYFYYINGRVIELNIIDNNSYLYSDGIIFYIDIEYKYSFEYILNKINNLDYYYINKNRIIIIYKAIEYKEDISIKTELDILYNKKGISILKIFNENDIDETLEKLAIKIYDELERNRTLINNKLNKYLNF